MKGKKKKREGPAATAVAEPKRRRSDEKNSSVPPKTKPEPPDKAQETMESEFTGRFWEGEEVGAALERAAGTGQAVLVEGPVGSGKSWALAHLARRAPRGHLSLQMGEELDAKGLLGAYVCGEVPGEFHWRPGPLGRAVVEGSWLILEDLDSASAELLASLSALNRLGSLRLRPDAPPTRAHPDFRLFGTLRTPLSLSPAREAYLNHLWLRISLPAPSAQELTRMIGRSHPALCPIAKRLAEIAGKMAEGPLGNSRRLGSRDALRWAARLDRAAKKEGPDNVLGDGVLIWREGFDALCGHQRDPERRLEAALKLASFLSVPAEKVEFFLNVQRPSLRVERERVEVGRALLVREGREEGRGPRRPFALHRSALSLLEGLAAALSGGEGVLLVGETGCGKTSAVEFLARKAGHRLRVLNLSQQTEAEDILGGLRPVSLPVSLAAFKDRFVELFGRTFDAGANGKFLGHVHGCLVGRRHKELVELMGRAGAEGERRAEAQSKAGLAREWREVRRRAERLGRVVGQAAASTFAFLEGAAVEAAVEGHWLLLDELNLAPPEVLSAIAPLLDSLDRRQPIALPNRSERVEVAASFRLIGCMNPGGDVGKTELSAGVRSRLVELWVGEVESAEELGVLAEAYLAGLALPPELIAASVRFYLAVRAASQSLRTDAWGRRPAFSLRSFCRALSFAAGNPFGNAQRSLYEGLCLAFLSQLDPDSRTKVLKLIASTVFGGNLERLKSILSTAGPQPSPNHILVQGFWLAKGPLVPQTDPHYKLTATVRRNLTDVARVVSGDKFPVLLEGETSVGKTSLIGYLAALSGRPLIRINNHEHTDLAEYLGSWRGNAEGVLEWAEGPLVRAVREGAWVVLDELNLAPSDVLEALNRLLDDNRQLFLPETQTTLSAHPDFRLFATQNPPGLYGGRKQLSKAFQNRFVQLQFSELPTDELLEILIHRSHLPRSYAEKMVAVFSRLQQCRSEAGVFAGKETYMTLRDVFRWGQRYERVELAEGEDPNRFDWDAFLAQQGFFLLAGRCRRSQEARLVQHTLEKEFKRQLDPAQLFSVSSPFFPPAVRELMGTGRWAELYWREELCRALVLAWEAVKRGEPVVLVGDTGGGKTSLVELLAEAVSPQGLESLNCHALTEAGDFLGRLRPSNKAGEAGSLRFHWVAGPLVRAMSLGRWILVDEISLAEDSVLERLNSVLEPERSVMVESQDQVLKAKPDFRFLSTMNPGGDYGKRELSKALRNRLTEIWCPSKFSSADVEGLLEQNTKVESLREFGLGRKVVETLKWVGDEAGAVTPRDLLAWASLVEKGLEKGLSAGQAFVHGASAVLLDRLPAEWRSEAKLSELCRIAEITLAELESANPWLGLVKSWGEVRSGGQSWETPTTAGNVMRVMRALEMGRGVLLEGRPGLGKSSLVVGLGAALGQRVTRLNLSEQTELGDLFGSDVPAGGSGGFVWREGPLLTAMRQGHWVLLDEMNLASQPVLEGLNSCLDHRGSVFIPELAKTFHIQPSGTRFFAAQNPFQQGGNRKGLPKSLLNRFTRIALDELGPEDQLLILQRAVGTAVEPRALEAMVEMNRRLALAVDERKIGRQGSPWEFNLRDLLRWTNLLTKHREADPGRFLHLLYVNRMRTTEDRAAVCELWREIWGGEAELGTGALSFGPHTVSLGSWEMKRRASKKAGQRRLLGSQCDAVGLLGSAVEMGWPGLLVGEAGSGKKAAVGTLAELLGRDVRWMGLSEETDALELLGTFEQQSSRQPGGEESLHFEWVDSPLLDAIRHGGWVVLENANLASGAVLDRLNSLLEPGGSLVVPEKGGGPNAHDLPTYTAHPDFRLFITLNPRLGPVSRAMRNRCVEICLLPADAWLREERLADAAAALRSTLPSCTEETAVACVAAAPSSPWTALGRAFALSSSGKDTQKLHIPLLPRPSAAQLNASPELLKAWLGQCWESVASAFPAEVVQKLQSLYAKGWAENYPSDPRLFRRVVKKSGVLDEELMQWEVETMLRDLPPRPRSEEVDADDEEWVEGEALLKRLLLALQQLFRSALPGQAIGDPQRSLAIVWALGKVLRSSWDSGETDLEWEALQELGAEPWLILGDLGKTIHALRGLLSSNSESKRHFRLLYTERCPLEPFKNADDLAIVAAAASPIVVDADESALALAYRLLSHIQVQKAGSLAELEKLGSGAWSLVGLLPWRTSSGEWWRSLGLLRSVCEASSPALSAEASLREVLRRTAVQGDTLDSASGRSAELSELSDFLWTQAPAALRFQRQAPALLRDELCKALADVEEDAELSDDPAQLLAAALRLCEAWLPAENSLDPLVEKELSRRSVRKDFDRTEAEVALLSRWEEEAWGRAWVSPTHPHPYVATIARRLQDLEAKKRAFGDDDGGQCLRTSSRAFRSLTRRLRGFLRAFHPSLLTRHDPQAIAQLQSNATSLSTLSGRKRRRRRMRARDEGWVGKVWKVIG